MNVKISGGVIRSRKKVVIYGPEGIGKSTLASHFPKPLFIDTEGSTNSLDVNRFSEKPTSWSILKNYIEYVKQNPLVCETLVIDTIDWAERLCVEDILNSHNKTGIEDFGYGNGYTYVYEEIGRFLNSLQDLIDKDICNVVLVAHAQLKKFEQPDEAGAYDRYELKLGKKTTSQTAPIVKEWADMILFCNYETFAVSTDKEGKKFKAQGGQRVMYTSHHPCWDAKNRDGLPPKLPMDYSQIAHIIDADVKPDAPSAIPAATPPVQTANIPAPTTPTTVPPTTPPAIPPTAPPPAADSTPPPTALNVNDFEPIGINIPENIPAPLKDLMKTNGVSEEEIRFAVASKGYFPEATPIANYPAEFISGCLISAWEQVFSIIKENRALPFK